MTNRDQIHEFYKKNKDRKFLFFKEQFFNFGDLIITGSGIQVDNKCTISPKLSQLG